MMAHLFTAEVTVELDDAGVVVVTVDSGDQVQRQYFDLDVFKSDWLDTETEVIQRRQVSLRLPVRAIKNGE